MTNLEVAIERVLDHAAAEIQPWMVAELRSAYQHAVSAGLFDPEPTLDQGHVADPGRVVAGEVGWGELCFRCDKPIRTERKHGAFGWVHA